MSFSLKSNFLQNARGLTFEDGGGITWSFNANTNQISATYSGSSASGANPTAKVGLTAVNGTATTFLRSDGSAPLDVSVAPTWTGQHIFKGAVLIADSGGTNTYGAGYLGSPINAQNSAYSFVLTDRGKSVMAGTTGAVTYTIPPSIFSPGDKITVINNNASGAVTVHAGSGMTLYWYNGSTQVSGDRTIPVGVVATLYCVNASYFFISGPGVS